MTNRDLILRHLQYVYPKEVSNSDLDKATKIHSHQTVFKLTEDLTRKGLVSARRIGKEWYFKANPDFNTPIISTHATPPSANDIESQTVSQDSATDSEEIPQELMAEESEGMSSARFEQMAREVFSNYFATDLRVGSLPGIPKKWDLLSRDGQIVGDAKFYTLVGLTKKPSAKLSVIAEHVWLLEKTTAKTKLLVFGHQIEVPRMWLSTYGGLVKDVQFYFLDNDGLITKLN